MSVNDVLDKLEQENFFNADVYILPPENGESDGDSEDSDDDTERCLSKPFAEHLTPQILKGDGSLAFVDDTGVHVIEGHNNEQSAMVETSSGSDDNANSVINEQPVPEKTTAVRKNKRQLPNLSQHSDGAKRSKVSRTECATYKELKKSTATAVLHESLPRVWKKLDLTEQQSKFIWNGSVSKSLPDAEPIRYFELFWDNGLFEKNPEFIKALFHPARSSFFI